MNHSRSPRRLVLAATASLMAGAAGMGAPKPARAQHGTGEWPSRPVRLVVPLAAAGAVDAMARNIAEILQRVLGQPFVVDNRSGAGGSIAAVEVARSANDGHTLLVATVGTHAINAALFPHLPYDPVLDFVPVTMLAAVPNVLVLNPARAHAEGIRSVSDLVAVAKARPGQLNMASSGNGTSTHLSGELFKAMTGSYMVHIPYRGSSAALIDLMAGLTDLMFDNIPSALPHVHAGRLTALAVTGAVRSHTLPAVPTIAEAGGPALAGYEATSWCGLCAPAGTPREIVDRLQQETGRALAVPALRERLASLGAEPGGMPSAAFAALIESETRKWARVVRFSGARPS